MNIKKRPQYIINSISIVYSALCLLPFLLVLSASFTNEHALSANGFKLLPSEFDLTAYEYIFKSPEKITLFLFFRRINDNFSAFGREAEPE